MFVQPERKVLKWSYIILVKFGWIRPSSFREEDFWNSANQKKGSALVAILLLLAEQKEVCLCRTIQRSFLQRLVKFDPVVSKEKIFDNRPIKIKNWLLQAFCLINRNKMRRGPRGPVALYWALVAIMFVQEVLLCQTIHRFFLQNFVKFCPAVSEEKMKMYIVYGWRTSHKLYCPLATDTIP